MPFELLMWVAFTDLYKYSVSCRSRNLKWWSNVDDGHFYQTDVVSFNK